MGIEVFFADEGLAAPFHAVLPRATVIGVAFLDFGSDAAATAATAKKAHKGFRRPLRFLRCPAPAFINYGAHGIKQLLGDNWRMFSFMHFATILEMTIVNGIGKHLRYVFTDKKLSVSGVDAMFPEKLSHRVKCHLAGRIHFKSLFDDGRTFLIQNDGLGAVIVEVSNGSRAGKFPAAHFLSQSALGVLGQRINIVFTLSEHDVEHEFALGIGFKAEGGEFERFNHSSIKKVNDSPAIHAVAGKAVRMPRENSFRFSGLYTLQHRVKNRSARGFSGLFLDQLLNDYKLFAFGKLAQLV